jgi:hypothetical protein
MDLKKHKSNFFLEMAYIVNEPSAQARRKAIESFYEIYSNQSRSLSNPKSLGAPS